MSPIQTPFLLAGANWIVGAFSIAIVLLHILFMFALWTDASRLHSAGRPTSILSPFVWGFAALLLGLVAVAFYWLAHHSRLSRR